MIRTTLQSWINDADNLRHLRLFSIAESPISLAKISNRFEDYYISLVGELFRNIDSQESNQADWAQLGNAFLQFTADAVGEHMQPKSISKHEARLFAAAAFYFGNYPASAYLTMSGAKPPSDSESLYVACYDFLGRPQQLLSQTALDIREFILIGDLEGLSRLVIKSKEAEREALYEGPDQWIAAKLLGKLLSNFSLSNLRAVLPEGHSDFWTPLIKSLIERKPSTWEFFPSQIEAISGGLLASNDSYSLQMPTGAGKTTLCETLLYWHLKNNPDDVAVMLVPYRSLASELRRTLVRRLNSFGLPSRCAYGGTVPTGDEVHGLANTRAVIATPEALSGLLGADLEFAKRIGLVICDEGHLLDGDGRGIGLELLLARLKARKGRSTRFVFMSAIVPNIEEINVWLGGSNQTVIRSNYRPAIAEFAVLRQAGTGANAVIGLEMHPHESEERKFTIDGFLEKRDFLYLNPASQRFKTYPYATTKAQVLAAARKALQMGTTAIFATFKRGDSGAIGIAESLVEQLKIDLPLPRPIEFASEEFLQRIIAYLEDEYTSDWSGTKCAKSGAVLHHGDIPQETREVLESLIRNQHVRLVICTSTLAEGVNLPIRTLVLYSVQRRGTDGQNKSMLARDIKNLVGRAGRAGANTKGLVICANPDLWQSVEPVAMQGASEVVRGSLLHLINALTLELTIKNIALSNEYLEKNTNIHPIIDGVDSTLIELLSDEIGEEEFLKLATDLAAQTFAASQLTEEPATNLRLIFNLRAKRLLELRSGGKTSWARDTGARVRLIDSVENHLLPSRTSWQDEVDPLSDEVQTVMFDWAWKQPELHESVKTCFHLRPNVDPETERDRFLKIANLWIAGKQLKEISNLVVLPVDVLLAVLTGGITFSLQTIVEQGISLLEKRLLSEGIELAEGFRNFPEHLRFGTPTVAARMLAAGGVRHRKACVQIGIALHADNFGGNQDDAKILASTSLRQRANQWRTALGDLVYQNTLSDLS